MHNRAIFTAVNLPDWYFTRTSKETRQKEIRGGDRKKGSSSFASPARIDHVKFVSVRGEGAVETASVASGEKKKNLFVVECFHDDASHSLENESASVVKARYDRARIERGFSYARIFENFARSSLERRYSTSLFRTRSIDPSVFLRDAWKIFFHVRRYSARGSAIDFSKPQLIAKAV